MDSKLKYLLLKTVQNDNILPVTSVCNMSCIFCSHRNNPPGLEVYSLGHLSLDLIRELIEYLPAQGSVIIGESASRIVEGDPMTHPHFNEIIKSIRGKFPAKKMVITTNGSFLNKESLSFLEEMFPLELNISLNCSSPEERVFLMSDKNPESVFSGLELLNKSIIPFQGSIVAMPHLIGWSSLDKAIGLLKGYQPETIRVFMPGFTRFSKERLKFSVEDIYQKLQTLVDTYSGLDIPILLEPPVIEDFNCQIKGIIKDTPADSSPLEKDDMIMKVDGREVISRVDGFNKILKSKNPRIEFVSGEKNEELKMKQEIVLNKAAGQSSGLIVDYDIDILTIERLSSVLINHKAKKIAIVTSVLGEGIIKSFYKYFNDKYSNIFYKKEIDIITIKNQYFGGSIVSAGLLVNQDIIRTVKNRKKQYELLILPGVIYDIFKNDLRGENYKKIESSLELSVEII